MSSIELSINDQYVRTWTGAWEGLRELIQNAVDAQQDGFPMEIVYSKSGVLRICNAGAKLTRQTLLLGVTSKAEGSHRGIFGEGYKLALMVLCRDGFSVSVRTQDEYWTPALEPSDTFGGATTLRIKTRKADSAYDGVMFTIRGVTAEQWDVLRSRILFIDQPELAAAKQPTILRDAKHKSSLYVRGIYVGPMPSNTKFGYNLVHVRLDRDRGMASTQDLIDCMYALFYTLVANSQTLSTEEFLKLVDDDANGEAHMIERGTCNGLYGDILTKKCADFWTALHGKDAAPVISDAEFNQASQVGLDPIRTTYALRNLLKPHLGELRVRADQRQLSAKVVYLQAELAENERKVFEWAYAAVLYGFPQLDGMHAWPIQVVDFVGANVNGTWTGPHGQPGLIRIARRCLQVPALTLSVMVHEFAHYYAGDGTAQHREAIEEAAGRMVAGLVPCA